MLVYAEIDHFALPYSETYSVRSSDTPIATITNQRKKIMCIKVDTAGAPLPGVEFNLYNASTMEKVETVVSDKNGVFTFSRFE